jgi:hypothetical protein
MLVLAMQFSKNECGSPEEAMRVFRSLVAEPKAVNNRSLKTKEKTTILIWQKFLFYQ